MLAEQLQRAVLTERSVNEIDAEWINGIRKGWRQMIAKTRRYPDRYEKATGFDFDKITASAKGAAGALDELIDYVKRLRADLLVNKGLWTTRANTRKAKGLSVDFDALKAKVVSALNKAEDTAADTRHRVKFWADVLTPGTGEYQLDGGRRRKEAEDSIASFQRYVNSVFLSVEEGADIAERAIDVMLDNLRDVLGKLPSALKFMGQRGHGEPDIVHIGKATVFFADSPEAGDRPTGRTGSGGKPWLPTGPKAQGPYGIMAASPRAPAYRRDYIEQMKKAEALLRQRGLGFLWYGRFSVHCKECGGQNPHGPEFTVGASYYRQGDYVAVYDDAHQHLYRLIAHELGHRYYYKFMSSQDRADFDRFFGKVKSVSKYGGMATEEDFAEVFKDYIDGRDLERAQIERFKQFIRGSRKMESNMRR
jgi:hypothetical protein